MLIGFCTGNFPAAITCAGVSAEAAMTILPICPVKSLTVPLARARTRSGVIKIENAKSRFKTIADKKLISWLGSLTSLTAILHKRVAITDHTHFQQLTSISERKSPLVAEAVAGKTKSAIKRGEKTYKSVHAYIKQASAK